MITEDYRIVYWHKIDGRESILDCAPADLDQMLRFVMNNNHRVLGIERIPGE